MKKRTKEILSNLLYFGGVIGVALLIITFVGQRINVDGSSMEPMLMDGDNLIVDKLTYRFREPRRFDVIVFPVRYDDNRRYIKRIIALPGETVQIKEERLYVDGVLVEEDGAFDKIADAGIAENEITLGSDEYFVLGDNRNNSEDSRSGNIGPVKRDNITGKAWFHMASSGKGMGFIK